MKPCSIIVIALALVLTALGTSGAEELTNSPSHACDWLVRSWQTMDGLPQNSVNAITQTRDGYLWVGTGGGLARFDGLRFRSFGLQDGLRSVRISTLLEDHQGVLWVGTTGGGLSRLEKGQFVPLVGAEDLGGADVIATVMEPDGTLWIGTDRGLLRWREGVLSKIGPPEGLPAKQIRALLLDSRGTVWVSVVPGGLFQAAQGRFVHGPRNPSAPEPVYSLLEDPEGSVWAGSNVGALWRWRGGTWQRFGETNGLPKSNIEALARGADNVIWAGTRNAGVYYLSQGSFHRVGEQTSFVPPVVSVRRLFVDRDGAIWVGCAGDGLSRLSPRMLRHWAEGLNRPLVTAVAEDASGGLWVGTQENGIYRFQDQRFSKLVDPAVSGNYPYIYSVVAATNGDVWAAGENCLFQFRPSAPTRAYLGKPIQGEAIRALCADGTNLWLGTYYSTLLKCEGTNVQVVATNGSFGGDIRSIVREAPDTLWIGSASGLYRWERGQVKVWNTRDGLLTASVQSLHRDPDGTLWIGTLGGGLARLKHGRIANITTRQGLIDDVVSQIVSDDFGHLWLGCNHGIMRLSKQELEDCADGRISGVSVNGFGANEGMLTEQCTGGHSPTALKTKDGRLLFPTVRGIVEIDPRLDTKTMARIPQATIEEIRVDGQLQSLASSVVIPPGKQRLEVTYAAPSLRGGDLVRYRYRLEPLEQGWVHAGTRRTAFYQDLRPGHYTFRVTACDNRGTYNDTAASAAIVLKPRFWQTPWFQTLGVLAIVAGAFAAHRWRKAHLVRKRVAQEAITQQIIRSQENERKRVASELHDGLSQNLALLSIEMEMLGQGLPEAHGQINARLQEFSAQAKDLSAEVHRISHGLHPAKLQQLGLAVALRGYCREVEAAHGLAVRFEARDVPRGLPEDLALCLYRVAQEAIQNVVKHSGAKKAQVELLAVHESIGLTITDDGRGFVVGASNPSGSLGLVSMQERVRLVHGEIAVRSNPGEGTCVDVRVPLPKGTVP